MAYFVAPTESGFTNPAWAGSVIEPEYLLPAGGKLDPAQFFAPDSVKVTVQAAAANGTTPVVVNLAAGTTLTGVIPVGTLLDFGGQKFLRTTVAGIIGATTITGVLSANLLLNDTARYAGSGTKGISVPSGTLVGRTYAERLANTPLGPADVTTPDDQIFLVAFTVDDLRTMNDVALVLPNSHFVVYENYLPAAVAGTLTTAERTKIRQLWATQEAYN